MTSQTMRKTLPPTPAAVRHGRTQELRVLTDKPAPPSAEPWDMPQVPENWRFGLFF